MDRAELRKRWIMGAVQPELFYIPWGHKKASKYTIYIRIKDVNGNPVNVNGLYLGYNTYMLYHNVIEKPDGGYDYISDETYKGYAFDKDTEWRNPVPLPSQWEILPLPNFIENHPIIEDSEIISVGNTYVRYSFSSRNIIEINNVPCGVFYISVDQPNSVYEMSYCPDYYNDYDNQHSVNRNTYQIDKTGKFSGFSYISLYHETKYYPIGYDFYCTTDKLENNILDIVCKVAPKIKLVFCWVDLPNVTNRVCNSVQTEPHNTCTYAYYYQHPNDTNVYSVIAYYGIVYMRHNYSIGKVLAVKIYVDNQYKGMLGCRLYPLTNYNAWNYLDIVNIKQYHWSTSYGLPSTEEVYPQPNVQLHYPLFEFVNREVGIQNQQIETNYRDSYYHNITTTELSHGGFGYDPELNYTINTIDNYRCDNDYKYVSRIIDTRTSMYDNYRKNGNTIQLLFTDSINSTEEGYYVNRSEPLPKSGARNISIGDSYRTVVPSTLGSSLNVDLSTFTTQIITGIQNNTIHRWIGDESVYEPFDDSHLPNNRVVNYYYGEDINLEEIKYYSQFIQYDTTIIDVSEL